MSFKIDGEEILTNNETYKFIAKHRSTLNPNASTWSIPFVDEFRSADDSINKYIFVETHNTMKQSFNVLDNLQVLGYNNIHRDLKLAKFVNSTPCLWHGYPADHVKNNQDRPTTDTLEKMLKAQKITLKQMSIICRGKKL